MMLYISNHQDDELIVGLFTLQTTRANCEVKELVDFGDEGLEE